MFENIIKFFKGLGKKEKEDSKNTAKERLHLVLAQDRANISADFLEMMKQEIIDVIKKYIDIDEEAIDVRMANKPGEDGLVGAPALYANIPILTIKNDARKLEGTINKEEIHKKDEKENSKNKEENEKAEVTESKEEKNSQEKEVIEENIEEKTEEENSEEVKEVKNEKKDS